MKKFLALLCTIAVISSVTALTGCGMSEEAESVQNLINNIPTSYSEDIDEQLAEARSAYDELSDEDKESVDDKQLTSMEEEQKKFISQEADKLNEKITKLSTSVETVHKLKTNEKDLSSIMSAIEKLPESYNEYIDFDALLKKIGDLSSSYSKIITNADKDINAATDMYNDLSMLMSVSSSSAQYGYACDVESDIKKLSGKWSTSNLLSKVEDIKDACLYGESLEVALAVNEIQLPASELTDSISSYYDPYLNFDSGFLDKCIKWQNEIKERQK